MNQRKTRTTRTVFLLAIVAILAACNGSSDSQRGAGDAVNKEQTAISTGLRHLTRSQPVPTFDWSQERQTVIDAETIRAQGTTGTTIFYLEGVGMMWWCPSSGAPVPSTYQLSTSQQWVDLPKHGETLYEMDQAEPTGVYIGPSNGTWVICLDDNGQKFAKYWEGPVDATIGTVSGLPPEKRARVDEITFKFTEVGELNDAQQVTVDTGGTAPANEAPADTGGG